MILLVVLIQIIVQIFAALAMRDQHICNFAIDAVRTAEAVCSAITVRPDRQTSGVEGVDSDIDDAPGQGDLRQVHTVAESVVRDRGNSLFDYNFNDPVGILCPRFLAWLPTEVAPSSITASVMPLFFHGAPEG